MDSSDRTILVTGGAGYIGAHAVKALEERGFQVIILDNLVYGHREPIEAHLKAKLVVGDISDRHVLDQIFTGTKIAAVMHFAAYAYVGESVTDPAKYYQNNVVGTIALLDVMRQHGVTNFVFSSTCATYGNPQQIPIDENHPQNPINPYGAGKLVIERVLKDYDPAYGLKSVIFRYFNAAGADPDRLFGEDHNPETHLIPLILQAAAGKRAAISVFGTDYDTPDGTCIRDYIHVTDLAQAHVLGLEYLLKHQDSQIFNLGNGNGFSVKEVIDTAKQVTGKEIPVEECPRRSGDPAVLIGSSDKARQILGWKPKYADLNAIVQHAWEWHQYRHF
ncbi:UDP-glucose 4-epimerase GalE [Chamaesiphon polymorphus]|uniref:UDP-glucose 4-epimerase n=1 Tax=Chamaesiphon polymorphus CCALA 037 TaxID=2107692 RepID=A0A2T1GB38_9CYAN|nr:UDP-glucose 4-epimerase GalE [Chamaesiphon polymorphus]PSB54460.1 UDP-glucose 4-epimerase GalE [Chamaesiphon polymorphus CCALA 037]